MRWLWIDRVLVHEPRRRLVAIKAVSLAEEHLHDHFPSENGLEPFPVMPGCLILEGMAQTAGILVGAASGFREKVVLAKISSASLTDDALPGMLLRYEAIIDRIDSTGASTTGVVDALDPAALAGTSFAGTSSARTSSAEPRSVETAATERTAHAAGASAHEANAGAAVGAVAPLSGRDDGAWRRIATIDMLFSHLDRNLSGQDFPEENFVFSENFRTILAQLGVT
ncbi:MAG TPA: hypothetical protein PKC43_00335 [Phycisphaerales bacterium]|nr:hypothetical protein [Phycisphaerales bacterium]HMP35872.1 hypothetical protein [Phycisphaerales bacterium]